MRAERSSGKNMSRSAAILKSNQRSHDCGKTPVTFFYNFVMFHPIKERNREL